jgi:hypothetical protein
MKGLIIAEPWISLILAGRKTREMRSRNTRVRGRIALIRKGSKTVVGVAELVDTLPSLPLSTIRSNHRKHRVPVGQIGDDFKWTTAWVLEHARPLAKPVPYKHPAGAVIWVAVDRRVPGMVGRNAP